MNQLVQWGSGHAGCPLDSHYETSVYRTVIDHEFQMENVCEW